MLNLDSLGPVAVLLITCFLVVLAILWFFLPFAVFGINSKLAELLRETRRVNDMLYPLPGQRVSGRPPPATRTEPSVGQSTRGDV